MFRLAASPLLRPVLGGLLAGALVATLLVGVSSERLTNLLLVSAAERALDHLELGALAELTSSDFEPPYTPERLDDLARRLEGLRQQVVRDRSGVIRLNLFARDGTLLYSDAGRNRGRQVDPHDAHLLGVALGGGIGAERSSLFGPENADLRSQFSSALEVYVPVLRDGQVVAAYEVYQDLGPSSGLLAMVWAAVTVLIAAVWTVSRLLRPPGRPAATGPTLAAPPGLLTIREREVLRLLATGLSNREIAADLAVGEETVRSHVKHILRKLNQPDRTAAVVTAMRMGLLRLEDEPVRRPAESRPRTG
jgi:DNA-binding CsgD family transcriptional regulator